MYTCIVIIAIGTPNSITKNYCNRYTCTNTETDIQICKNHQKDSTNWMSHMEDLTNLSTKGCIHIHLTFP